MEQEFVVNEIHLYGTGFTSIKQSSYVWKDEIVWNGNYLRME